MLLSKAKDLRWSSEDVVNTLLNFPDSQGTFDLVESLGEEIQRAYWVRRPRWVRCKDDESIVHTIKKFKDNGRAIDALVAGAQQWKAKDPLIVFQLLDKAIKELNDRQDEEPLGNDSYWLNELFKWLRHEESVDKAELARREYAYLPLLAGPFAKTDLALHEILADDPEFFVRVLCDLYRPASDSSEGDGPTKEARLRAEFAWKLLGSWKQPRGVSRNGSVSLDRLKEWVEKARQLATEVDRLDVADREIGKVLFHFPSDPGDSLWPHVELRQLLETLQNESIETGIELEQFNSRGVVNKAMFEGGAQERVLAEKWRGIAGGLGIRWPRTRAMCERIASYWESDAKREDERAQKQRLQLG